MKVFIRKTAQGSEYWDNEEKRTLFVPKGKKPSFDVTENPKSLIGEPDLATDKNKTVIDGINLEDLEKEQLLSFAEENNIDIPGNVSKEETIRNHIHEHLYADDE